MTDDRSDEELVRALRAVRAPAHRPSFWNDLEERLRTAEPLDVVSGDEVERAGGAGGGNRPPWRPLLAAAAAVLVVVAGIAAVLTDGDTGQEVDFAEEPTTTVEAPTTSAPEATTTTVPEEEEEEATEQVTTTTLSEAPPPAGFEEEAVEVVRRWLSAVEAGDRETTLELMEESTRQKAAPWLDGSQDAFGEVFGGWARSPDVRYQVSTVTSGKAVVTLWGTVEMHGDVQRDAQAFPVVTGSDGAPRVSPLHEASGDVFLSSIGLDVAPFDAAQPVQLQSSAVTASMMPGSTFAVFEDGKRLDVTTEVVQVESPEGVVDELRLHFDVRGGPGERPLTVVAFRAGGNSGTTTARAVLIQGP